VKSGHFLNAQSIEETLNMFKNILVPTDGSPFANKAAKQAVQLAKSMGARVTGFHVAPAYRLNLQADYIPRDFMTPRDYEAHAATIAAKHLKAIEKAAADAGVKCEAYHTTSDYAADAIVKATKRYQCDAIAMGSHGRTGLTKLLLGSETQKVLAATKLPVIVLR